MSGLEQTVLKQKFNLEGRRKDVLEFRSSSEVGKGLVSHTRPLRREVKWVGRQKGAISNLSISFSGQQPH